MESLSERQEVLSDLVEDKSRIHSKATEKYYETIFEEMRELEEKKSKEALTLIQKSTFCYDVKAKGKERECCKGLQDRERPDIHRSDARDILSFESYSSSMTCDIEEMCSKDMDETTSEASWTTVTNC